MHGTLPFQYLVEISGRHSRLGPAFNQIPKRFSEIGIKLWRRLAPANLLDIVVVNGLKFNGATQQSVVFHVIGALSEFGKIGIVCVAPSFEKADRATERPSRYLIASKQRKSDPCGS
jgi:PGM1 C-terminal domain